MYYCFYMYIRKYIIYTVYFKTYVTEQKIIKLNYSVSNIIPQYIYGWIIMIMYKLKYSTSI